MSKAIDIEKSEKLPHDRRYLNISVLWIFYFRLAVRLFYRSRIPHEVVTLLSIISGLFSAWFLYNGALIIGALLLHLKDIFDASDGALARLTGRGHLIGRYLDSLGDFVVLHAVVIAISLKAYSAGSHAYIFWGGLTLLSIFIQCSFFNFYQLAYVERYGIKTLSSKRDEINRDDINRRIDSVSWSYRMILRGLRLFYIIVYSWQDKLVASVDRAILRKVPPAHHDEYYGDKTFMTLQSPLCFGTHIFIIIIFALIGRPEFSLIFISVVMNLYLLLLLYLRKSRFAAKSPTVLKPERFGVK